MELVAATCRLRRFRPEDAPSLARHANDRDVWLNLRDRFPHPYAERDAAGYIAHAARQSSAASFAIDVDGEAIGSVSLHPGHDVERVSGEIGYWLGRAHWGRGIVTDAVRLATTHAFAALGLRRVFAVPFASNAASSRVLEKAGYVREGLLRHSAVKDGVLLDQLLWAAYDDRWPPAPHAPPTAR
jgi:ribosomal-protein-alanine N-acetyltransferase